MARVEVDYDLCESNALCEGFAPEVFALDDDDIMHIEDGTVTDENRARVDQAVASCPKAALRIVEEG